MGDTHRGVSETVQGSYGKGIHPRGTPQTPRGSGVVPMDDTRSETGLEDLKSRGELGPSVPLTQKGKESTLLTRNTVRSVDVSRSRGSFSIQSYTNPFSAFLGERNTPAPQVSTRRSPRGKTGSGHGHSTRTRAVTGVKTVVTPVVRYFRLRRRMVTETLPSRTVRGDRSCTTSVLRQDPTHAGGGIPVRDLTRSRGAWGTL